MGLNKTLFSRKYSVWKVVDENTQVITKENFPKNRSNCKLNSIKKFSYHKNTKLSDVKK